MSTSKTTRESLPAALTRIAGEAGASIPPAWPLAATVAVNPFLGQAEESLATASHRLARATGVTATMDRSWYRDKLASGAVTDEDIADALKTAPGALEAKTPAGVRQAIADDAEPVSALPTIADLAAQASGIDWPAIIADRITAWAGSYFDEGQAFWTMPQGKSVYASWRSYALHDLTSEIVGLQGFAAHMSRAPDQARDMFIRASKTLGLDRNQAPSYFHQLLMSLGGWGQYARYKLWQSDLAGDSNDIMLDMLAIRIAWEEALFLQYEDGIKAAWKDAKAGHGADMEASQAQLLDALLQEACERAEQRRVAGIMAQNVPQAAPAPANERPAMQLALCIDVRSEVFRRALESLDASIETLGFAGFFGLTISHKRFASDVEEHRLPVLLNAGLSSVSGCSHDHEEDLSQRYKDRAVRAWGRFKLAAVSTFAFVEAAGPMYISKLLRDAFGFAEAKKAADPAPQLTTQLSPSEAVDAAETILNAMSLTDGFGRLVILAGHGAHVENNPHESALQCGACGGYSGEANARLLAQLLNNADVRTALEARGIHVPADTLFLGGLHSTTTDKVELFIDGHDISQHGVDIKQVKAWLAEAGKLTRIERAMRLPGANNQNDVRARSRDWSQVRPEWGLAGCSAFIAAPRARTRGKDLGGRSFLHNYTWQQDKDFSVLELIMTAPVVVGSWISLQYFGSVTAPEIFGGGNKLLHNVIGGLGVLEGNTGPMRAGLPWQSVHDGDKLMHDPLRLTVAIEAPCEAMSDILERHPGVRALFDNRWLHLIALDDKGQFSRRYVGNLHWEAFDSEKTPHSAEPAIAEA
ncbi:MAG: DUF2309 domain-containing protein [Pseudomonadota bacterium]